MYARSLFRHIRDTLPSENVEILYIYCNIPYSRSSGAAFSVSGAIGRDWMGKKVVGRAGDLDAVRLGLGVSGVR